MTSSISTGSTSNSSNGNSTGASGTGTGSSLESKSTFVNQVTLFAVFSDGALVAQQDNPPVLRLYDPRGSHWSWSVARADGFSGRPHFWITYPHLDNTTLAHLNWSGIDHQDWEFGREGVVVIEGRAASGLRTSLSVEVAVRSIDQKDLTFFTPTTSYRIKASKSGAWGPYQFLLKSPTRADGSAVLPLQRLTNAGDYIDVQLSGQEPFAAPLDTWLGLGIKTGTSTSVFRLRVCTRPLRVKETGEFPCAETLTLVQGQPLTLEIEGEPSSSAGFTWSVDDVTAPKFRQTPSFAQMGRGSTARLDIQDLTDLDWIAAPQDGSATLVVQDGRRKPARLPITFGLQQLVRRFALAAGTQLTGPDGEKLEISEGGQYLPVVSGSGPDTRVTLKDVPVEASDEGSAGNLPGGSVLTFNNKLPLIGDAVVTQVGLTGGSDRESNTDLRDRVRVFWADPPAHGDRSNVLQIVWQVGGVDRAFVYPPFALDGLDGLGKVGCALVAQGTRAGVSRRSSLAAEVRQRLATLGSFTAEYVIMDVDDVGTMDKDTGKGALQVDVEVQVKLANEYDWPWSAAQNLLVGALPDAETLIVYFDPTSPARRKQVALALHALAEGDTLYVLGQAVTVKSANPRTFTIKLAGPLVDEDGDEFDESQVFGARIYPVCPLQTQVETALQSIFENLGTSEAPERGEDLPWQRRYPLTSFIYPDTLRVAEITNQLMDIEGVADMRVVAPEANVTPPSNTARTLASGERVYTTSILSLRRISVGPMRATPGLDSAYPLYTELFGKLLEEIGDMSVLEFRSL